MRYMLTNKKLWKNLKPKAQENRSNPTSAERIMWSELRNKKLGYRSRRQHVIAEYIVDFVCIEKKIIVELDGEIHLRKIEYDTERTRVLNGSGFRVIRFKNEHVINELKTVIEVIKDKLK
ncbi:MAG: endonuclease domain-containing protein [Bacteroidetes bacterium]|nr:MAG: endonuclease domain-containing protein [Bacteroidota bacterium]